MATISSAGAAPAVRCQVSVKGAAQRLQHRPQRAATVCVKAAVPVRVAVAGDGSVGPSTSSTTTTSKCTTSPSCHQTRRQALMGTAAVMMAAMSAPAQCSAGPIGDSIKGVLLRARRQNGGAKLLAPFETAKLRLQEAMGSLGTPGPQSSTLVSDATGISSGEGMLSALQTVRASSLNCYVFEALPGDDTETRASLITQQLQFADPCTFRLVVKNVVDFSPVEVQTQGTELLNTVIRSYSLLDDSILNAMQEGSSSEDVEQVKQHLQTTYNAVATLETFVEQAIRA